MKTIGRLGVPVMLILGKLSVATKAKREIVESEAEARSESLDE
jgi:hypothetical protein